MATKNWTYSKKNLYDKKSNASKQFDAIMEKDFRNAEKKGNKRARVGRKIDMAQEKAAKGKKKDISFQLFDETFGKNKRKKTTLQAAKDTRQKSSIKTTNLDNLQIKVFEEYESSNNSLLVESFEDDQSKEQQRDFIGNKADEWNLISNSPLEIVKDDINHVRCNLINNSLDTLEHNTELVQTTRSSQSSPDSLLSSSNFCTTSSQSRYTYESISVYHYTAESRVSDTQKFNSTPHVKPKQRYIKNSTTVKGKESIGDYIFPPYISPIALEKSNPIFEKESSKMIDIKNLPSSANILAENNHNPNGPKYYSTPMFSLNSASPINLSSIYPTNCNDQRTHDLYKLQNKKKTPFFDSNTSVIHEKHPNMKVNAICSTSSLKENAPKVLKKNNIHKLTSTPKNKSRIDSIQISPINSFNDDDSGLYPKESREVNTNEIIVPSWDNSPQCQKQTKRHEVLLNEDINNIITAIQKDTQGSKDEFMQQGAGDFDKQCEDLKYRFHSKQKTKKKNVMCPQKDIINILSQQSQAIFKTHKKVQNNVSIKQSKIKSIKHISKKDIINIVSQQSQAVLKSHKKVKINHSFNSS